MCGRYELHSHPTAIALAFGLARIPALRPRYNIAPMTDVPVVRVNAHGERELVELRWGLVPRWAKDPSIGSKMINARGETLAERPSFRTALRRHRCLVPADGFYEWLPPAHPGPHAHKQPVHIGLAGDACFGMGGLYERWLSPDGVVLDSCTIITTAANDLLSPFHDRMPLIVSPEDYARWLDPADAEAEDLIQPFPAARMKYYPVSTLVNAVRNDRPELIAPIEPAASAPESPPHPPEQESLF